MALSEAAQVLPQMDGAHEPLAVDDRVVHGQRSAGVMVAAVRVARTQQPQLLEDVAAGPVLSVHVLYTRQMLACIASDVPDR